MSIADAAPTVLHRCIQLGWVPQVADENTSLRLQVALLTGQRDDLARELDRATEAADALWARVAELEAAESWRPARVAAPTPPILVAWAALCGLWFDVWARFETTESALGERV